MPVIHVQLFEDLLDDATSEQLIVSLTAAVTAVLGDGIRPYSTVIVEPVPRSRWGTGGAPAPPGA